MATSPLSDRSDVPSPETPLETRRRQAAPSLALLANRTRPHQLAKEELIPLLAPLAQLLRTPGLRRGSTLVVQGTGAPGASSLALGLIAAATTQEMWCAVVDLPGLGLLAALELGVALEHLVVLPSSKTRSTSVVSSLLDGFDVVLMAPPADPVPAEIRRLIAKARERHAVLIVVAPSSYARRGTRVWPEIPDIALTVVGGRFFGLGQGSGHLSAHLVEVEVMRRRNSPPRYGGELWLPSPSGDIAVATMTPELGDRLPATQSS